MALAGSTSATPLVAVLLVTSTSFRGPEVVFRYPRKPCLQRRLSSIRYFAPAKEEPRDEEARLDRALWEEQEEDSESEQDLPTSDDIDSDESSTTGFGDGEESSSAIESDVVATEPESDDTDRESSSDVMSTTHTADSSRRRRGSTYASERKGRTPRVDGEGLVRFGASKNVAGSSAEASLQRAHRSPSQARMLSSSLRDRIKELSPDSEQRGDNRRRKGGLVEESARRIRGDKAHKQASPERRARNARAFSQYLGYPVDFLAEMLAPKIEMCNRRFELVVDDLAFIGHPVYRKDQEGKGDDGRDKNSRGDQNSPHDEEEEGAGRIGSKVEMFHLVLVIQPPDPSYASPTLDLTTWLGLWYDSVTFKMTAGLWAEEQRCSFVSAQNEMLLRLWGQVEGYSGGVSPSYALHLSKLLSCSSLARSLRHMHRCLTVPSYDRTPFVILNDSLDIHLQLPPLLINPYRMVKSIQELGPSVEADDADLFGDATITAFGDPLDEWIRATGPPLFPWKTLLLLHDAEEGVVKQKRHRSIGGVVVEIEDEDDKSQGQLDAALEADVAAAADAGIELWTRKFTSLLTPTLQGVPTFAELALLLSWDLQKDVYPMARHLVYYKQARISDVPHIENTYTMSPLVEPQRLPQFALSFALGFPDQPPLLQFLSVLGSSLQPFVVHFTSLPRPQITSQEPSSRGIHQRALRRQALDVLIWLLRHEIIIQQHLRFRLIATESVKRKARELWEARRMSRKEILRKRRERRERRREKIALKKGGDHRRRKGDYVPFAAQSAPAELQFQQRRLNDLATMKGGGNHGKDATGGRDSDLPQMSPRSRSSNADVNRDCQRSRSAGARETSGGQGANIGLKDISYKQDLTLASRSRSRNAVRLGRVDRGVVINSRLAFSGRLHKVSMGPHEEPAPQIEFRRRTVSRSRSPSSTLPLTMTSTELAADASIDAAKETVTATSSSRTAMKTAMNMDTTPSSRMCETRHNCATSSSSGGGTVAGGLSSTPREKAALILAAEQQQRRRDGSVTRDRTDGHVKAGLLSVATVGSPFRCDVGHAWDANPMCGVSPGLVSESLPRRGRGIGREMLHGQPLAVGTVRRISRSPSEARLKISGFGEQDEKVWIDGKEVTAETRMLPLDRNQPNASSSGRPGETPDFLEEQTRRLSLVGEEEPCDGVARSLGASAQHAAVYLSSDSAEASSSGSGSGEDDDDDDDDNDDQETNQKKEKDSDLDIASDSSNSDYILYSDTRPSLIADPSRASGLENAWISAMIHDHSQRARGSSAPNAGVEDNEDSYGGDRDGDPNEYDKDDLRGGAKHGVQAKGPQYRRTEQEAAAEIVQVFFRLLPYLNGRHTIEEVLCREGMQRRQLRKLLDHFKEEIMTFVHP